MLDFLIAPDKLRLLTINKYAAKITRCKNLPVEIYSSQEAQVASNDC